MAGVSCQIYTQIQEDGYHYDRPAIDVRLNFPTPERKAPLPVKPNIPDPITLPPLPSFIPQINLPKVVPVKPASQPLPVKPDFIPEEPEIIPTLPPLPSFIPQINLPKVLPVKPASQSLPVKPLPEVQKPAPFAAPRVDVKSINDYLPPLTTNDYLPPINDYLSPAEDVTDWISWKVNFFIVLF